MIEFPDFEAMKLVAGDVLLLRPKEPLSMKDMEILKIQADKTAELLGIKVVVVDWHIEPSKA